MSSVCIMQPAYLPWIGYFQRIAMSDVYVCLDHVKIDENNKTKFTNRNRILTPRGPEWLTIPYLKSSSNGLIINELEIDNSKKWQQRHWNLIQTNYRHAPYFSEHELFFKDYYSKKYIGLVNAIKVMTDYMLEYFMLNTPIIKSSDLSGLRTKSELNLDICAQVNANLYIAGPFSRDYLDHSIFEKAKITVTYHDFTPEPYPQLASEFIPYLSAIDLMFNCPQDKSIDIMSGSAKA